MWLEQARAGAQQEQHPSYRCYSSRVFLLAQKQCRSCCCEHLKTPLAEAAHIGTHLNFRDGALQPYQGALQESCCAGRAALRLLRVPAADTAFLQSVVKLCEYLKHHVSTLCYLFVPSSVGSARQLLSSKLGLATAKLRSLQAIWMASGIC